MLYVDIGMRGRHMVVRVYPARCYSNTTIFVSAGRLFSQSFIENRSLLGLIYLVRRIEECSSIALFLIIEDGVWPYAFQKSMKGDTL